MRKLRLGMSDEAEPMLAESVKSMEQDKKTPARFLAEAATCRSGERPRLRGPVADPAEKNSPRPSAGSCPW